MRILKIESLPQKDNNWVDAAEIMLHSCFQILKDCVENEHVDTHCNYESHKEFVDEVRFLYGWWLERMKLTQSMTHMDEDNLMLIRLMKIRNGLWT